jgi:hypothetical protein
MESSFLSKLAKNANESISKLVQGVGMNSNAIENNWKAVSKVHNRILMNQKRLT